MFGVCDTRKVLRSDIENVVITAINDKERHLPCHFAEQQREQRKKDQVENTGRDEQRKRIAEMSIFLRKQPTAIAEYNEQLVRRLIEKVTVVYEGRFDVEFKSGVTVEVEA